MARQARLAAAFELCLRDEAHVEVGAARGAVVQRGDVQAVEVGAAALEVGIVVGPGLDGVVGDPGGGEDGLPEGLDGLVFLEVREHLLGPGHTGHGGDAPLVFALHLLLVGLQDAVAGLLALGHLFEVDALEAVRVLGDEVDAAGQRLGVVPRALLFPFLHGAEGLEAPAPDVELLERLVVPVHRDLGGPGAVALLHHQLDEFGLVQPGVHQDLLPLLHMDAAADDEPGVVFQSRFVQK